MAQYRLRNGRDSDPTIIEVFGDVTARDIYDFLDLNLKNVEGISKAIFDFREANLSLLSKQQIKNFVKRVRKFSKPDFKTALVFSNPTDFSIGKSISNAVNKEGYLSEIRGFYNLYRAKDWLLFPYQSLRTTFQSAQTGLSF